MNAEWFERQSVLLHQIAELQKQIMASLNVELCQNWFSPSEIAEKIRRKPSTVRAWCRNRRINARKRMQGRGGKQEWEISIEELNRFREHGLLPERGER